LPNRGVNVGYNLFRQLHDTAQLTEIEGELEFPAGTEKLILSGNGNTGPRQRFADKLANAIDRDLAKLCNRYIWLAAFASNNINSDYHWMVDACYYECKRRRKPKIYQREYDALVREHSR
jgi:hypothetical protein